MTDVQAGGQSPVLSPDDVYAALTSSLSLDTAIRTQAQARLQEWDAESTPGFIGSLLSIVQQAHTVPEEARLMATVVAKNAVGSSWQKIMGTREWSRVPGQEKEYVRSILLDVLLSEPSPRVALQLALLIANVARFDVPRPWASLLPDLAARAALGSAASVEGKLRALRALKHVLRGLRGKRFAIDAPPGGLISLSDGELAALTAQIDADRDALGAALRALLAPMTAGWRATLGTLLTAASGVGGLPSAPAEVQSNWGDAGRLAAAYLAVQVEALGAIQDLRGDETAFGELMREGAVAAGEVAPRLAAAAAAVSSPGGGGSSNNEHLGVLLCKVWERLLGCALAGLDRQPLAFAGYAPAWARLCAGTALLGLDAGTLHSIRSKSRVLLTRFTARVLIQPMYRADFVELHSRGSGAGALSGAAERTRRALPALSEARAALDELVSPGRCEPLVAAVVSKYIALSPEELAEWEADAEGFARQVDVETSPDADTPRPCGVALLECMIERNQAAVCGALVDAAAALQATPLTRETLLLREATYRAVGECFAHVRTRVSFPSWYEAELRGILLSGVGSSLGNGAGDQGTPTGAGGGAGAPPSSPPAGTPEAASLDVRILQARALWLVGVCGEELGPEAWAEAYRLCVAYIPSPDLVVALMAVSASTALVAQVLEEGAFLAQAPDRSRMRERLALEGLGEVGDGQAEALDAAAAELAAHTAAVEASLDALVGRCFALLARLGESESMVRVLQAVSAVVELLGARLAPHLGVITAALPGVWDVVAARRGGAPGAAARLHAALIGVVAHLVARLGHAAVREPRVAGLLAPLLRHATDVASPEAEPLLDDGLRLWRAVLSQSAEVGPLLGELFAARLVPILRRGQDTVQVYGIAEAYVLLGGPAVLGAALEPLAEATAGTLRRTLGCLTAAPSGGKLDATAGGSTSAATAGRRAGAIRHEGGLAAARARQSSRPLLQADEIQEALSACSLLLTLLQSAPRGTAVPAALLSPARAAAALVAADFGGAVARLPARALGVLETALQVEGDQLALRRLVLAASSPLAAVDAAETVRVAARQAAAWLGERALLTALESLDPSLPDQLAAVARGGEEREMLAALEAMSLQKPEEQAHTQAAV